MHDSTQSLCVVMHSYCLFAQFRYVAGKIFIAMSEDIYRSLEKKGSLTKERPPPTFCPGQSLLE